MGLAASDAALEATATAVAVDARTRSVFSKKHAPVGGSPGALATSFAKPELGVCCVPFRALDGGGFEAVLPRGTIWFQAKIHMAGSSAVFHWLTSPTCVCEVVKAGVVLTSCAISACAALGAVPPEDGYVDVGSDQALPIVGKYGTLFSALCTTADSVCGRCREGTGDGSWLTLPLGQAHMWGGGIGSIGDDPCVVRLVNPGLVLDKDAVDMVLVPTKLYRPAAAAAAVTAAPAVWRHGPLYAATSVRLVGACGPGSKSVDLRGDGSVVNGSGRVQGFVILARGCRLCKVHVSGTDDKGRVLQLQSSAATAQHVDPYAWTLAVTGNGDAEAPCLTQATLHRRVVFKARTAVTLRVDIESAQDEAAEAPQVFVYTVEAEALVLSPDGTYESALWSCG